MGKLPNNIIGITGEYLVCAELGKRGILGLLTPKNNPLFDIVATSLDGKRSVAIQVKTMSNDNNQGWKLGKDICIKQNNENLFVVLVNMKKSENDFFIYQYDVLSERVKEVYNKYISTPKKDGSPRKDVDFRWFDFKEFTPDDYARINNWGILGFN
ncbi:aspartate-ammonia lyase [Brevibacillus brevis]|uniref:aspartate-ammonia lyase n=1 Tax=Brevibacillus brevis TaxID=1393 RepID=UPI0037C76700